MATLAELSYEIGMDTAEAGHYRDLLNLHFERRKEANPRYSLRSFARACGISPSTLSLVLRSKMTLSPKRLRDIGKRLKLRREEVLLMTLLASKEKQPDAPSPRIDRSLEQVRTRLSALTLDERSASPALLTWEAIVICQFLRARAMDGPSACSFFERRFGIDPQRTRALLDRLAESGMLNVDDDGRYHGLHQQVIATAQAPNAAFRSVHRRFLEIALEALEKQSTRERYSCTELFAIPEEKMPALRALTNRFLDELQALAADDPSRERKVYAATFHAVTLGDPE